MNDRTDRLYFNDHLCLTKIFDVLDRGLVFSCGSCNSIGDYVLIRNRYAKVKVYCKTCLDKLNNIKCSSLLGLDITNNFDIFVMYYERLNREKLKQLYQIKRIVPDNDDNKYNDIIQRHLFNNFNFIFIVDTFHYINARNPMINTGNQFHEVISSFDEQSNYLVSLMFIMYALADTIYFEDEEINNSIHNDIINNNGLIETKKIIIYTLHACNIDIESDDIVNDCANALACWVLYYHMITIY